MCCSRSTLGLTIGILNIVCYVGLIVISVVVLENMSSIKVETFEEEDAVVSSRNIFICIIVLCLIMTVISGLLVVGIVKKYHNLMLPWLIIAAIGYIYNCGQFTYVLFSFASAGASMSFIFTYLALGLIGFAISALILTTIFKLYSDIRRDNMEKPDRAKTLAESGYKRYQI